MGYGLRNDVFGAWVGALYTLRVLREGLGGERTDGHVRGLCSWVEETAQRR